MLTWISSNGHSGSPTSEKGFETGLYLDHAHAGVQEDGSFGLLGDLLILVEVEVVGAVPQLGQMEIPPLEGLKQRPDQSSIERGDERQESSRR